MSDLPQFGWDSREQSVTSVRLAVTLRKQAGDLNSGRPQAGKAHHALPCRETEC